MTVPFTLSFKKASFRDVRDLQPSLRSQCISFADCGYVLRMHPQAERRIAYRCGSYMTDGSASSRMTT